MEKLLKRNEDLEVGDSIVFDDEVMKIESIQLYLPDPTSSLFGMVKLGPGAGFVLERGGFTNVIKK